MRYGRDTRTRWDGVYARHTVGCEVEQLPRNLTLTQVSRACDCEPSYWGQVYDRAETKHVKTKTYPASSAARHARKALLELIEKGGVPKEAPLRVREAHERFIEAARANRALNKKGRPYKQTAIRNIDQSLAKHVLPALGARRLVDVRPRDIQRIVDDLSPKLSGSRIRSVVNAIRSLYAWAKQRELVTHDPAAGIRLPALNVTPRERIAPPREFVALLDALAPADALPYAIAGYAWARRAQIQHLHWSEIDLKLCLVELGADEEHAGKSAAAHHVVPIVKPLLLMLKREWLRQGRPAGEQLVCPPRNKNSKTGLLHTGGLDERATKAWEAKELQHIGLHECRHTAASWLDAAGVSPKTASVLMSHSIPDRQPGAAAITLRTYTHLMPEALETARKQVDDWLAAQLAKASDAAPGR
ncbi:MAG TPA: tyrosine-type recombinase/integrase [Solirubrobacteraceae bacterium]|jgi:integrase|nr:tyrosine-type recombinase/integrase [Solirubrobacteraceae bacterium]